MIYNAQGDIYQKKKKRTKQGRFWDQLALRGFPQQFDMETTWEWSFMNAFLSE